jgi:hypothetical protein
MKEAPKVRLSWYVLGLVFVTVKLWWQELLRVARLSSGISNNKAASPPVWLVRRAIERLSSSFSDALPRRKTEEEFFGAGSFNKRLHLLICRSSDVSFLLAGHGGLEKEQSSVAFFKSTRWWGTLLQVGVDPMVAAACRHDFWLMRQPLQMPMKASTKPPRRRPCDGFPAAFNALFFPCGFVPGEGESGRRWSPSYPGGGEERLDCFSYIFSRILSAKLQDWSVIFVSFWSCINFVPPPYMI